MKVLFALSDDGITSSILKKYQEKFKEIITAKSVYYFNAIIKELQKDKTFDAIVIGEDLEPLSNNDYDQADKFIFEKLDEISDEASNTAGEDIPIIFICADRRTRDDKILVKFFGIGVYNALVGNDRSIDKVCELIYKPRSKKEAKVYYKLEGDSVSYTPATENEIDETQVQNILNYFAQIGNNEQKIVQTFDHIADQYTDTQLRLIANVLPLTVKATLESSSTRYQKLMNGGTVLSNGEYKGYTANNPKKPTTLDAVTVIEITDNKNNNKKGQPQVVIPSSVKYTGQVINSNPNINQRINNMNENNQMNNLGQYPMGGQNIQQPQVNPTMQGAGGQIPVNPTMPNQQPHPVMPQAPAQNTNPTEPRPMSPYMNPYANPYSNPYQNNYGYNTNPYGNPEQQMPNTNVQNTNTESANTNVNDQQGEKANTNTTEVPYQVPYGNKPASPVVPASQSPINVNPQPVEPVQSAVSQPTQPMQPIQPVTPVQPIEPQPFGTVQPINQPTPMSQPEPTQPSVSPVEPTQNNTAPVEPVESEPTEPNTNAVPDTTANPFENMQSPYFSDVSPVSAPTTPDISSNIGSQDNEVNSENKDENKLENEETTVNFDSLNAFDDEGPLPGFEDVDENNKPEEQDTVESNTDTAVPTTKVENTPEVPNAPVQNMKMPVAPAQDFAEPTPAPIQDIPQPTPTIPTPITPEVNNVQVPSSTAPVEPNTAFDPNYMPNNDYGQASFNNQNTNVHVQGQVASEPAVQEVPTMQQPVMQGSTEPTQQPTIQQPMQGPQMPNNSYNPQGFNMQMPNAQMYRPQVYNQPVANPQGYVQPGVNPQMGYNPQMYYNQPMNNMNPQMGYNPQVMPNNNVQGTANGDSTQNASESQPSSDNGSGVLSSSEPF